MADADQEPKNDGLEELPEKERKETEEIIKEIAAATPDSKPDPKPEVKPEDKPEEKPEKKDEEKPIEPKPEESRKTKMIPAWQFEKEQAQRISDHKKWEEERQKLTDQLANAGKASAEKPTDNPTNDDAELRKKTDSIAEKAGIDPDAAFELAKIAREGAKPAKYEIPEELKNGLDKVTKIAAEEEARAEESRFNADFDARILPLVKQEYGDDVPTTVIEKVKDQIKDKAYTDEYSKVPLTTIYKGEDNFRGLIPPKQRGAEASRGGHQSYHEATHVEGPDLTQELSGEELNNLTPEQFDTYAANMEKREKNR